MSDTNLVDGRDLPIVKLVPRTDRRQPRSITNASRPAREPLVCSNR